MAKPIPKKKRRIVAKGKVQKKQIQKKVKRKQKPKEPSIAEQLWQLSTETLKRIAPDEITVFADRVHTVDLSSGQHYWTFLGRASRVEKESSKAIQHFQEEAADLINHLGNKKVMVQKYKYEKIPYCKKHRGKN